MELVCHTANQSMASNGKPQSVNNVFSQQSNGAVIERLQRFGGQDKTALPRGHAATSQPEPHVNAARSQPLNNKTPRSKKHGSTKRKTVHLVLWVKPIVKAELKRIADQEGLSLSKAAGTLLARVLDGYMDRNYHALLDPMIKTSVAKHMGEGFNRLAWLLVRNAFVAEQNRAINTNILGRMPGMTEEKVKHILAMSQKAAKANITRTTPEMRELVDAVENFLFADSAKEQERTV
jgi:hypothetical protein